VINVVGPVGIVFPDGGVGDAERLIDGGREVFRGLRRGDRIASDLVGGPDNATAGRASTGEEDGLDCSPVIATGESVVFAKVGDLGSPAEFAGHYDEGVFQKTLFVEIVEESGDTPVHGGEEFLFEMGEGVSVGVPGFIVTEIDLDEIDTGFDESGGHQEGPTEGVSAVILQFFRRGERDIEGPADLLINEEGDGCLAVGAELP